jgi:hypothetical protein
MKTVLAPLAFALLIDPTALAQAKAKAPARAPLKAPAPLAYVPPAKVTLGQVHDRRSDGSFFKRLEINLELPDIPAADVAAARTVVTTAVDDTGRNLVPDDSGKGGLQPTQQGRFGGSAEKSEPLKLTLELKNPARKANVVTSVAGEIELYMPGKDPTSIATIPKFTAQAGRPLADPALKANGVEIALVGKEQLEAEKKRQLEKLKQDANKKKIAGETLEEMIAEFSSEFLKPDEGDVVLKVHAPEGRIQQIVYVDAAGQEKLASMSDKQGFTVLSTWGEKPGSDWSLRVRMKSPKTLVRYSYALKDVPLP